MIDQQIIGPPGSTAPKASDVSGQNDRFPPAMPRLVEGAELLGASKNSGYRHPPCLVRRRDGQVIQLSPLLYSVAAAANGQQSLQEIAERVHAETGTRVSVPGVGYLLTTKLASVGLVADPAISPELPRAKPLLALRARRALIPPHIVDWLAARLRWLFWPPLVAAAVVALCVVDYRLFLVHSVAEPLVAMAVTPAYFLVTLGLIIAAMVVHELGHASGCKAGGGKPGPIGVGIYLVWPAFYTNVSDAYRLGRGGQLRTDLGGPYFTTLVVVLCGLLYEASGFVPIVIAALMLQMQTLVQLLPVVRFDGYYVLTDLVGVPDLFGRIGPILRSIIRRRMVDERVTALRPRVRLVVTTWVVVVVPMLTAYVVFLLVHLPAYVARAMESESANIDRLTSGVARREWVDVVSAAVRLFTVALPVVGITLVWARLAAKAARVAERAWKVGERRKAALVSGGGVSFAGLVVSYLLLAH